MTVPEPQNIAIGPKCQVIWGKMPFESGQNRKKQKNRTIRVKIVAFRNKTFRFNDPFSCVGLFFLYNILYNMLFSGL